LLGETLSNLQRFPCSAQGTFALQIFRVWVLQIIEKIGLIERMKDTKQEKMLHLICGDIAGDILRKSSVSGEVLVWMEIFIEGPTPGNVSEEEWRRVRAEFISTQYFTTMTMESALQGADDRYKNLEKAKNYEEVILWFDACMFDQTLMIHLIDRLAKFDLDNTKLSLICAGEYPGFKLFNGFGELTSVQMASLLDTRHEISLEEIKLAGVAWQAFTSDNPYTIENLLAEACSALPYLGNALKRFLQKYPSTRNGLNRTQNAILKVVASGANKLGEIFSAVSALEERPFMGDTSFWQVIHELATAPVPLLDVDVDVDGSETLSSLSKVDRERPTNQELRQWHIAINEMGRKALSDEADFVHLNGIDCWLGGVHLMGNEAQWRWDEEQQKLYTSACF
jgi:Domain of unknown function (DUF1835)